MISTAEQSSTFPCITSKQDLEPAVIQAKDLDAWGGKHSSIFAEISKYLRGPHELSSDIICLFPDDLRPDLARPCSSSPSPLITSTSHRTATDELYKVLEHLMEARVFVSRQVLLDIPILLQDSTTSAFVNVPRHRFRFKDKKRPPWYYKRKANVVMGSPHKVIAPEDPQTRSDPSDEVENKLKPEVKLPSAVRGYYLNRLPIKICIDFLRGRCYRRKCNYSHELMDPKKAVQDDCAFCKLGLCTTSHCTLSSLLITDSKLPKSPTGLYSVNNVSKPPPSIAKPTQRPTSTNTYPEEISTTLLHSARVTIGPGFQIKEVTTSFESTRMSLGNLSLIMSEEDVRLLLDPFGVVLKLEYTPATPRFPGVAIARFEHPSNATDAVYVLNGLSKYGTKFAARLLHQNESYLGRLSNCLVNISMPCPGIGCYVGYDTKEEAEKVIKSVHGTVIKKQLIGAYLHEGAPRQGRFTVRFEGLHYRTTVIEMSMLGGVTVPDWNVLYAFPAYNELSAALPTLRTILQEHGEVISIDIGSTPPLHGRIQGTIRFCSSSAAASACAAINGRKFVFLNRCTDNPEFKDKRQAIYLEQVHRLVHKVSPYVKAAIEPDLRRLIKFAEGNGLSLRSGEFEITVQGSKLSNVQRANSVLQKLIRGETVMDGDKPVWDSFFSTPAGDAVVRRIARMAGTCIRVECNRCYLKVWGSTIGKSRARAQIIDEVRRLRSKNLYGFPLRGKLLTKVMFDQMDSVYEEIGKDNVRVDFTNQKLVVRGSAQQFKWVVETLAREASATFSQERSPTGTECPICFDVLEDGVTLECGHSSCRRCITRYLATATEHKAFPLKCLGSSNFCQTLIPLSVCKELLRNEQFTAVMDASFYAYIRSRPDEFHFCPTPGCQHIYRTDSTREIELQCPSCLVYICPKCHEEQHFGEECGAIREENEHLFQAWKDDHDVKACPSCSFEIEKIEGCNHMICTYCGTHICWICSKTFDQAAEVYVHLEGHVDETLYA